jgi:DNA ligase D-like protein (predicted ligase)
MRKANSLPRREAAFVDPMECLAVPKLPEGPEWLYEIKWDGYRALAINCEGKLSLYSRNRKSFHRQYVQVFEALRELPPNTVLDGEIVALDDTGRPNFNLLQHFRAKASKICYFVFDLPIFGGSDLMRLRLVDRRAILKDKLQFSSPLIRIAPYFATSAATVLQSAREQGLEGVVAKRRDSRYESGKRSGAWAKFRLNTGQELVVGGYVPGSQGVEAIIVGYYKESKLIYVARVRNGFVPATRRQIFAKLLPLTSPDCPFANLPETHKGRWGTGLTADHMKKCVWVHPNLVAQIEYLEWTESDHLRHARFTGLRDDKLAQRVVKEHAGES